MKNNKFVIITDLDGTLLDLYDQSYRPSLPYVELLKKEKIPLIFCSAKTRAEQERLRKELGICDPFIVENGGAIFIPKGYFSFSYPSDSSTDGYDVIVLGMSYFKIREKLIKIRKKLGVEVVGFGDVSVKELAKIIGLDEKSCELAKNREYDETLIMDGLDIREKEAFLKALKTEQLNWTYGGRFFHIHGDNDKGKAVEILKGLFKREYGDVTFVGIGDTKNDIPMFKVVDLAFLVQKKNGSWEEINLPDLIRVKGIGPYGWAKAIKELFSRFF